MKRRQKLAVAVTAAMGMGLLAEVSSAATAYSDNFNSATGSGTSTISSVNGSKTYTYNVVATAGSDGGAFTDASKTNTTLNTLSLTNDATTANNVSGIVYAATSTSSYGAGFNNVLQNNTGNLLTWSLNMQQIRTAPSGMAVGNYGAAYILGATSADFANAGQGYALIIGNTGSQDSIRLYKYTNGLNAVGLSGNSSTTAGAPLLAYSTVNGASPTGTVADYFSIKVTFDAATSTWGLAVRDDGASAFADPTTSTGYAPASTTTDATYVGSTLTHSGAYWAYSTGANQTAKFDNFGLDISPLSGPVTPRSLTWDADGTGAATDGSGTWATANNWVDTTNAHFTYDGTRPDNATFGAATGTGATATIDLGGGNQNVGQLTFAANSATYTLTNGTLNVAGWDDDNSPTTALEGIVANQSATINTNVNWVNTAHIHVNNATSTLTVNGALQGAGHIDKFGTGTLVLNTPSPAHGGSTDIEAGTVRLTSTASGIGGLGTGQMNVKDYQNDNVNPGVLWFDASAGDMTFSGSTGQLFVGNNATLRVTGNVTWQKNYPMFGNGTSTTGHNEYITVDANSTLLFRAQIRNSDGTVVNQVPQGGSYQTIHLNGPGTVKLTNGGTNGGGDSGIFGGSWDVSNGRLILGQNSETGGSTGDALNNLGFKDGDSSLANTVTVRDAGTLIATENTHNGGFVNGYKASLILQNGGAVSSGNGKDANWAGNFTVAAGANASKVLTGDPIAGNSRNFNLTQGTPGALYAGGNTAWNGNLVVDGGGWTGGKFVVNRDGGTVAVTPGATITVNKWSGMDLTGTVDALSDGTNHVKVVNNSITVTDPNNTNNVSHGFRVLSGVKNIASLTGTGETNVESGAELRANGVRQGALNIANGGKVVSRKSGSNLVRVDTLNLNSNGTLDLEDNDLIVDHGNFATIIAKRWEGYRDAPDTSATGIISSAGQTITGAPILAVFDNSIAGFGDWPFGSGETIGNTAVVGQFTYIGDADLNGQVTPDDYGAIDSNLGAHVGTAEETGGMNWLAGDWNFDGDITPDDYGGVDANLGNGQTQGPQLGAAGMIAANGLAAVPEPTSLGLLGVAGLGMLSRRRRKA